MLRALSLLPLLLAIAVLGLWAVSYRRAYVVRLAVNRYPTPDVWQSRAVDARLVRGHWMLRWERLDTQLNAGFFADWDADAADAFRRTPPAAFEPSFGKEEVVSATTAAAPGARVPSDPLLGVPRWIGFGHRHLAMGRAGEAGGVGAFDIVAVPAWFSVLALLAPSAVALARSRAGRRRRGAGRCVGCGYDLRASPDRCPECGARHLATA